MSSPAPATLLSRSLRVFVAASEPARRAHLRALLLEAGHRPVDSVRGSDVVLSDGNYATGEGRPVVTLGGVEMDHAGSLNREASPAQIEAALRAVAAGLLVRSRGSGASGFGAFDDDAPENPLTPREAEVLRCVGEGLTNKLIARRLDISLHTVKFHIESLLRKLGATTRAQALAKALERRSMDTVEF